MMNRQNDRTRFSIACATVLGLAILGSSCSSAKPAEMGPTPTPTQPVTFVFKNNTDKILYVSDPTYLFGSGNGVAVLDGETLLNFREGGCQPKSCASENTGTVCDPYVGPPIAVDPGQSVESIWDGTAVVLGTRQDNASETCLTTESVAPKTLKASRAYSEETEEKPRPAGTSPVQLKNPKTVEVSFAFPATSPVELAVQ